MSQLFLANTSVLEGLDWVVLGIYFLALIGVAVWVVLQKNNNEKRKFEVFSQIWLIMTFKINDYYTYF